MAQAIRKIGHVALSRGETVIGVDSPCAPPDGPRLAARQPPQHQHRDRGRDGKDHDEGRGFFGDRVTGLRDSDPHVDARSDEPERDKDLGRPGESDRRSRTANPPPDQET